MRTSPVRRALGGALVTAATAAALLSAPLQAEAAPAGEQATAAVTATCRYVVNNTGVRARYGAGTNYGIYRTLSIGEVVTGPCVRVWNGAEGRYWVKLNTAGGFYVYAASEYLTKQ